MKPQPRKFTRDSPCTKRHLWECFRSKGSFLTVNTVVAHSIIGINAPRVMERNGYLVKKSGPKEDVYELTEAGKAWLIRGIISYAENHPSEAKHIKYLDRIRDDELVEQKPKKVARRVRRVRTDTR